MKIIIGDNADVTAKVCQEVDLDPGDIILGHEIEDMSEEELGFFAEGNESFRENEPTPKGASRSGPESEGSYSWFLGDGINDAGALRTADVGISVDTAVDVARVADIILLEKSLMVLEQGVIQGRVVFGNIVKYIKMTASSNFGNAFSVLVASAFIPFLPIAALQCSFRTSFTISHSFHFHGTKRIKSLFSGRGSRALPISPGP